MKKSLLLILLCCLLLTGCGSHASTPTVTSETTMPPEVLTVYSPNETADGFHTVDIPVPVITDAVIIQQLVTAGVLPEGTCVNTNAEISAETGKTTLTADFNDTLRQAILSMGTSGEYVLMGSIVNTFLIAYQADAIIITVDGAYLETGHSVYDHPLSFYHNNV